MSNPYGSPDADPPGGQPTQPFWLGPGPEAVQPTAGEPAGAAAPRPAGGQAASFGGHPKSGRRTALHWTLGLTAAALLIGGATAASLSLLGHSSPGPAAAQVSPAGAGQAALLNSALSHAGSPGAGAAARGTAAPACARARRAARAARRAARPGLARWFQHGAARCRLFRHRVFAFLLLRGVDGQFTIQTRRGIKTLAYERGVIQSVNAGKSIVVKAADGTTWTWDLVSTTVVRDRPGKVPASTLTAGTPVWVGGPVTGGAKDARLIVLRPPQPPAPPSSTPDS